MQANKTEPPKTNPKWRNGLGGLAFAVVWHLAWDDEGRGIPLYVRALVIPVCLIGGLWLFWPLVMEEFRTLGLTGKSMPSRIIGAETDDLPNAHWLKKAWAFTVLLAITVTVAGAVFLSGYSYRAETAEFREKPAVDAENSRLEEEKIKGLQEAKATLEDRISTLEEDLAASQKLAADRLLTAETLKQGRQEHEEEFRHTKNAMEKQIADLTGERDTLQDDVTRLREDLESKRSKADRLQEIKNQLLSKVEAAPSYESFTAENGKAWISSARLLVDSVVPVHQQSWFKAASSQPTLEQFQTSVESLRALAVSLKEEHLRD